jgi:hypothetical protein
MHPLRTLAYTIRWPADGSTTQLSCLQCLMGSPAREPGRTQPPCAHLYICTRLLMPASRRPWNSVSA